jgi:cellulose biosynthesis protein BcsQ
MKTIGFFNNKGGVGTTSLVYHIAWMMSQLDCRVIAADLDPQANLTSLFLTEERLDELFEASPRPTIYGAVSPQLLGVGDVLPPVLETIDGQIGLLAGDLELSRFEDDLSYAWPKSQDGDERSFRVMSAFARAIRMAGEQFGADVALVDVGPNLGPLNRAALLACDCVVVPLAADLMSLQGLRNMGPPLRAWREGWLDRRSKSPDPALVLPGGAMSPVGYVVMRHSVTAGRPVHALGRWMSRIPAEYRSYVLNEPDAVDDHVTTDPNCLAQLKDYRSLMPLAQEARKPMFLLRPADGAFGGHQQAVQSCYMDFKALTINIMIRCEVPISSNSWGAIPLVQ